MVGYHSEGCLGLYFRGSISPRVFNPAGVRDKNKI